MAGQAKELFAPFPFPAPPALPKKLVDLGPLSPDPSKAQGSGGEWTRHVKSRPKGPNRSRNRTRPRKLPPLPMGNRSPRSSGKLRLEPKEEADSMGLDREKSHKLGPRTFHPDSDSDRDSESHRDSDTESVDEYLKKTDFQHQSDVRSEIQAQPIRRSFGDVSKSRFDAKYAPMLSNLDTIIKSNKKKLARL